MTFKEIVKREWPRRPIRITVGKTEIYMGINSSGLNQMRSEVVDWLDNHELLHCWSSKREVELVYKGSEKFNRLIFKE